MLKLAKVCVYIFVFGKIFLNLPMSRDGCGGVELTVAGLLANDRAFAVVLLIYLIFHYLAYEKIFTFICGFGHRNVHVCRTRYL